MRGVGEAKMPSNLPHPLYGQRGCAAVIAGLGWFGLGVQLYFNIHDALVKNLPVAGHLIDYFSFFTIETNLLVALVLTIFCTRPQAEQFLTTPKRHFGTCRLYYHCRRGLCGAVAEFMAPAWIAVFGRHRAA